MTHSAGIELLVMTWINLILKRLIWEYFLFRRIILLPIWYSCSVCGIVYNGSSAANLSDFLFSTDYSNIRNLINPKSWRNLQMTSEVIFLSRFQNSSFDRKQSLLIWDEVEKAMTTGRLFRVDFPPFPIERSNNLDIGWT